MIYKVNITRQAEEDIRGIFEYIAYDLKAAQTAINQLARIESEILSLDHMPERYRSYDKEPWHSRGLRVMPVDYYLVFYVSSREKQTVDIIRVMYGGRNIDTQLDAVHL